MVEFYKDKNYAIREFTSSCPKLRTDLTFHFESFQNENCCIIEDPITSEFYRVGTSEYYFIKHLNGKNSIGEVLSKMAETAGIQALSEKEAFCIVNWLIESQLIQTGRSTDAKYLKEKTDKLKQSKLQSKLNPLFIKLPLFNPDRLFTQITPFIRFFFSFPFLIIWLCTLSYALYKLGKNYDSLLISTYRAFLPNNWLLLLLSWIGLKCIHECWHGFACKTFGGNVPEAGIMLILLTPLGYVDATSSWRFSSKWYRICVGLAGMYIELFLAAIAAIVWFNTEPGFINAFAYNVMLTGSVITLFFNANPLMRFDGYYILSDFIEIPNLYTKGMQSLKTLAKRFLLGINEVTLPDLRQKDQLTVLSFGIAAFIWRIFLMLSILITASFLFKGFGLLLAIVSFLLWVVPPFKKLILYLKNGTEHEQPRPSNYLLRIAYLSIILILLAFIPFHPSFKAFAVVYPLQAEMIRVDCPGFVDEQFITEKQSIKKGRLLTSLINKEETTRLNNLKLEREKTEITSKQLLSKNDLTGYMSEISKLNALKTKIEQLDSYVSTLQLKAPIDGFAIPMKEDPLQHNAFLTSGTPLFRILPTKESEITLLIEQNDIEEFISRLNQPVQIKLKGYPSFSGAILTRLIPRATYELPHPALSATNNGPIAVAPNNNSEEKNKLRLLAPYFIGTVVLTNKVKFPILEGHIGKVKFKTQRIHLLGNYFYKKWAQKIQSLLKKAKQLSEKTQ